MSKFAPPEVIEKALTSGAPSRYLCKLLVDRARSHSPDMSEAELSSMSIYFMTGIAAAFDLFMTASDLPETLAMQVFRSIEADLEAFSEILKPSSTPTAPMH